MRDTARGRIRSLSTASLSLLLALSCAAPTPASSISPGTPEFVARGEFDGDGTSDVATAFRGDHALAVLYRDAEGRVARTEAVALPGAVTALVAADVNRRDGLTDVLVGVAGARL